MSTETGWRLSLIVPLLGHWHGGDGIKFANLANINVGSEKLGRRGVMKHKGNYQS